MSSKASVLNTLHNEIDILQKAVGLINKVEKGWAYKIKESWEQFGDDSYGVLIAFNKESIRFRILASDSDAYSDELVWNRGSQCTNNVNSFTTAGLARYLSPFYRSEQTLVVGMKYVSKEMAGILKGEPTKVQFFNDNDKQWGA